MALSILNNISALTADNQLSITQANLQKTLTQLSSGSKINSGADDAAGLSIANGMQANIAALTQSGQNATNGIGLLQTADGALSQVTSLLNRAVTLATEASSQGLTNSQSSALDSEFQSILTQINSIGNTTSGTMFNGSPVFTASAMTPFLSDGSTGSNLLGTGTSMAVGTLSTTGLNIGGFATDTLNDATAANVANGDTVTIGTTVYTFTTSAPTAAGNQVAVGSTLAQTLQNLANAVNGGPGAGSAYSANTTANAFAKATNVSATSITFTAASAGAGSAGSGTGNHIAVGAGSSGTAVVSWSNAGTFSGGTGSADLLNSSDAANALNAVNAAINTVSSMRGHIGAYVNQLQAASNVINTQVQNLTSASGGITDADVASTVANMTKYNVLEQTGMAALSQANQAQQSVLKLLQ